jgi:hypothetical protein
MTRTEDIASGKAYLRDPEDIKEDELPWQAAWNALGMRRTNKRLVKMHKEGGVPQRHYYWANHAATTLESYGWDCQLVEECGAGNRSFELDTIVQFPNSLTRYQCKNFLGMVCRVVPDYMPTVAGDDKRLDRQYLGKALLHDIGVSPSGPHGAFNHFAIPMNLLGELREFGYFEEDKLEKLPFWRNEDLVAYGENGKQTEDAYVTVYRHPVEGGGYRAFFVILNEADDPVELPLTIKDSKRILGGLNTLKAKDVHSRGPVPEELAEWWGDVSERDSGTVMRDLETGAVIAKNGNGETYGPVYVPYRNYRILYAEYSAN